MPRLSADRHLNALSGGWTYADREQMKRTHRERDSYNVESGREAAKDPDEWVAGDEPMSGAVRLVPDRPGSRFRPYGARGYDQGRGFKLIGEA